MPATTEATFFSFDTEPLGRAQVPTPKSDSKRMQALTQNPTLHLIDDDAHAIQQISGYMTRRGMHGRRFASLVTYLDWLDYDALDADTVIVADVDLPNLNGLDLLDILRADGIVTATVLMGGAISVAQAVEAMHAGAGYLLKKPFTDCELETAVSRAMSRAATAIDTGIVRQRYQKLSPRQRQLLELVFHGRTNRQIADRLSISQKTVELHRSAMMQKMGADTLVDLIRLVSSCRDLLQPEFEREPV